MMIFRVSIVLLLLLSTPAWSLQIGVNDVAKKKEEFIPPPPPPQPPPPPPNFQAKNKSGRPGNAAMWRVFSMLDPQERKAMMELQAKDPDEFRLQMQTKVDALRKAEREREQKLKELVEAYHKATPAEQPAIEAEITTMIRKSYQKRLDENRRHLEETRRRVEWLSQELSKREKNADRAIQAAVQKRLERQEKNTP